MTYDEHPGEYEVRYTLHQQKWTTMVLVVVIDYVGGSGC